MGVLRFLLALSVLAAHCGAIFGYQFVDPKVAVQAFFIISGFYMSFILNEKYIGINKSYKLFITNRFIRIYPIYWAVLIATVLTCLASALISKNHSTPVIVAFESVKTNVFSLSFIVLTNIVIFGQDIAMFLGINPSSGGLYFVNNLGHNTSPLFPFLFLTQAWTLALELMFYLLSPFILRRSFKLIFVLTIASLLLRFFIYYYLNLKVDPWSFRFFPTEILFFLLGNLSYRIYSRLKKQSIPLTFNMAVFISVVVFTISYDHIQSLEVNNFPFTNTAIVYFLLLVIAIPLLFNFFKSSNTDRFIGELSYPIYISHLFVAMVCQKMRVEAGWIIALSTIITSYFLNKFVAMPLEKYRQSRIKKAIPVEKTTLSKYQVAAYES